MENNSTTNIQRWSSLQKLNMKQFPLDLDVFSKCEPIYEELPGWDEDISQLTTFDSLPVNAKNYVTYVSEKTNVQIKMVSVGTRRRQTIHLLTI